MRDSEGAPRYEGSRAGPANRGSSNYNAEILGPIDSQGNELISALQRNGVGFWIYCTQLDRTFSLDFDDPVPSIARRGFHPPGTTVLEGDRQLVDEAIADAVRGNETAEFRFRVENGDRATRWIRCAAKRIPGSVHARIAGIAVDVTTEMQALEAQILLTREMQHRMNNLFAVVSGITSVLAREHSDVTEYSAELCARLTALSDAHALVAPERGRPEPTLFSLVDALLAPYRSRAFVHVSGPEITLAPTVVTSLTLIFHEWATNSVKHGALGLAGDARLNVSWAVDDGELTVLWLESVPGRHSARTVASGFGSRLMTALAKQLGARIERLLFHEQVSLSIALPAPHFRSAS